MRSARSSLSALALITTSLTTLAHAAPSAPAPAVQAVQDGAAGNRLPRAGTVTARPAPRPPARAGQAGSIAAHTTGGAVRAPGLASAPPPRASGVERLTVHGDSVQVRAGGGMIQPGSEPQASSLVGQDFIARQAPTSTAYELVAQMPGANVSGSDPFGFSPQTNISIRGMNGDAIGYVLEGMPLNDIAYYTGYPSQFADSENYESVAVQQGAPDLDSPVLNAAGGLMKLRFRTPSDKAGGFVNASYGSYNTNRQFLRLESGEIGRTGLRGFVSYSHAQTDNWRGPGRDERQHVDFKLEKTWGHGNSAAFLGSWNQAIDSYYPQATLESWRLDGIHGANNLAARFDPTNDAAGTDYWRLARQPERTLYMGAPVTLHFDHGLTLRATPYAQGAYGNAPGGTQLPVSGLFNGATPVQDTLNAPVVVDDYATVRADYTQRSYRSGFTAALDWTRGHNTLSVGYWYDYGDDAERETFAVVGANGHAGSIWGATPILTAPGQPLVGADNHTIAQTNALFLGDRLSLLHDRLLLSAGFKEVMASRTGTNGVPGAVWRTGTNTAVPLPRLGARFQITPHHQVFFDATTNFRTPAETAMYDGYDPTSGALIQKGTTSLRNEYSIAEELGYRYADDRVVGTLTLFNYNFTNRQIATLAMVNGAPVQSTLNAGGQTSRGVDVEVGLRPWHHFSPYVSGEYLHATIDNDLYSGGDWLPTRGRRAVRSPTLQAAGGLTYDDGHLFGVITAHYTGHQYATFMNDERIPGHVTANLALGYRLADVVVLHRPEFRLNFINISNQHYLSGVADPTLNARDTQGRNGTVIAGETPDYYIGGGFATLFTASTGF
ncbi:MAG: TonB-dependent receptor [Acetobacter sp.]